MRVGFIGLGKLGLPVAATMAAEGLSVYGYDRRVKNWPESLAHEEGLDRVAERGWRRLRFCESLEEVVKSAEIIFIAVETPHQPCFEGITPLPDERADFDYRALSVVIGDIATIARHRNAHPTLAVISTVLPGTTRRVLSKLAGPSNLVYNPSFIAMGTTVADFLRPEFVLIGGDHNGAVAEVYQRLGIGPIYRTTIANAELIKVAYNTFIGLKLAFANTLLEVCEKTECDVDAVADGLAKAHRRLMSPAYLRGGMGDGGACHPRDNIALSWLARELDLSHDLFDDVMYQREQQARWLVDEMLSHEPPPGLLGIAYKPGSHLTAGSHALLVREILREQGHEPAVYDPYCGELDFPDEPRTWLVGCRHPDFTKLRFPKGSIVIDPWRYIVDNAGATVRRLGEGAR